MNVVSVVNQKGGVGKTTTVANLGASLAQKGLRTLLIDLDPQANLTLGLNADVNIVHYTLPQALLEPERVPLAAVVQRVGTQPLYLAAGHMEMARVEAAFAPHKTAVYGLRDALRTLSARHEVDWVLIDCPPSLGLLTQNAIVASNYLLVPTEPSMYAFAGMDTLNKMVAGLAQEFKFEIELLGVLLTLVQKGTRLHRTIAGLIRERFGDKVFETEVPRNMRVSEAEVEGKPVALFDPRAAGARTYAALADEVLARAAASGRALPERVTTPV